MPTCSLALVPIRCRPAPCENVILRCASVDQRLTGTDSSMKLRRRSVSSPLVLTAAVFIGGGGLNPPSRRLSRLLIGLSGRVTAEREINLPLILSPKPAGRNLFHTRPPLPAAGSTQGGAVRNPPDRAARIVRDEQRAICGLRESTRWQAVLGVGGSSENAGEQKRFLHGNHRMES